MGGCTCSAKQIHIGRYTHILYNHIYTQTHMKATITQYLNIYTQTSTQKNTKTLAHFHTKNTHISTHTQIYMHPHIHKHT